MKNNKLLSKVIRCATLAVVMLLCFAVVISSVDASNTQIANAETIVRNSSTSVGSLPQTGETVANVGEAPAGAKPVMALTYDASIDWVTGLRIPFNTNMSPYMAINETRSGVNLTFRDNGALFLSDYLESVMSARGMFLIVFKLDSKLQTIAKSGALKLTVSGQYDSWSTDPGSVYINSSNDKPADGSWADDGTRIYNNDPDNFEAFSGNVYIGTACTYVSVGFMMQPDSVVTRFGGEFKDILLNFQVDTSKLNAATQAFTTSEIAIRTPAIRSYGVTPPAVQEIIPNVDGNSAVITYPANGSLPARTLSAATSVGHTVNFNVTTPSGIGQVVSGGNVTERVTFEVGGVEKTLAAMIGDGYMADTSSTTWQKMSPWYDEDSSTDLYNANTIACNWTFKKNAVVTVKIYNMGGSYLSWQLTIAGVDTDAPACPTSAIFETDWKSTDTFPVFNAVADNGPTDVRYYYAYSYNRVSYDNIPDTNVSITKNSPYFTEDDITPAGNLEFTAPNCGFYKIKVVAVDMAGNVSAESSIIRFKADFALPIFSVSLTKADGSAYIPDSWTNQSVKVKFNLSSSGAFAGHSGVIFRYSTDNGANWNNVDGTNEITVNATDTANNKLNYYFMASTRALNTYSLMDTATGTLDPYCIQIDAQAPTAITLDKLTDGSREYPFSTYAFDYDTTYNWITSNWAQSIAFNYSDAFLDEGGHNYYVQIEYDNDGDGTFESRDAAYAIALTTSNNSLLDMGGAQLGGARRIKIWAVDQAGNSNEATANAYTFLLDANNYSLNLAANVNAATNVSGGSLFLRNADGTPRGSSIKRGETFKVYVQAQNGYRFMNTADSGLSYTLGGTPLVHGAMIASGNGFITTETFNVMADNIGANPLDMAFTAFFKKVVTLTEIADSAPYTAAEQMPTFVSSEASANAFTTWESIDASLATVAVVGGATPKNAGTYTIELTPKANESYCIDATSFEFEVAAVAVEITADALAATKVYGDADAAFYGFTAPMGALKGDDAFIQTSAYKLSREVGENVGSYAFTIGTVRIEDGSGNVVTSNYVITVSDTVKLTVTKKPIELALASYTGVYTGAARYVDYALADGFTLVGADVLDVKFLIADVNVTATAAPVAVRVSDPSNTDIAGAAANANYSITYPNLTYSITPLEVWFGYKAATKVYGTVDGAFALEYFTDDAALNATTLVNAADYTVTGTLARAAGEDVNTYNYVKDDTITIAFIGTIPNFTFKGWAGAAQFSITPASVTVEIINDSVEYGEDYTAQLAFKGVLAADDDALTSVSTAAVGIITAVGETNLAASVLTDIATALGANYTVTTTALDYDRVARAITVTTTKTTFSTEETVSATAIGLGFDRAIEADDLASAVTLAYYDKDGVLLAAAPTAEGSYTVRITGVPATYSLASATFIITIGAGEQVKITLTEAGKVYDGTAFVLDLNYEIVGSTTVVDVTNATVVTKRGDSDVTEIIGAGKYDVTVTVYAAPEGESVGYFGYAEFTVTIEKRVLTVTPETSSVYGELASDSNNIGFTSSNLATGHSLFAGNVVKTAGLGVGEYALSCEDFVIYDGGGSAVTSNYEIELTAETYTITSASITYVPKDTVITYGDLSYVIDYDVVGDLFYGDTKATIFLGGSFLPNISSTFDVPGEYGIFEGANFVTANYDVTVNTTGRVFRIDEKTIEISPDDVYFANKSYDGTVFAAPADNGINIAPKLVGSDSVGITYDMAFVTPNIGRNSLRFTNIALIGDKAACYKLVILGGGTEIVKEGVYITQYVWVVNSSNLAVTVADRDYDGTDVVAASQIAFVDGKGIPAIFRNGQDGGVRVALRGVYTTGKAAAIDTSANIYVELSLPSWSSNVVLDTTGGGVVQDSSSTPDKLVLRLTVNNLDINKINLNISNFRMQNKVFDNRSGVTRDNLGYDMDGYISGDSVYLDVLTTSQYYSDAARTTADANAGDKFVRLVFVAGGLAGADKDNYVLQTTGFSVEDEYTDLAGVISPAILVASATIGNHIYNGSTDATVTGKGFTLKNNTLLQNYVNAAGGFAGKLFLADTCSGSFVDPNVRLIAGEPAPVKVNVTGIALTTTVEVGNSAYALFNPANYTFENVSEEGVLETSGIISLAGVGVDVSKIILNTKKYDKTTNGSITMEEGGLTGIIAADAGKVDVVVSVTWATASAGSNIAATIVISGLKGANSSNYRIENTVNSVVTKNDVGTILPAEVTVSSIVINDKVYDATSTATVRSYTLSGVLSGDSVSLVFGGVNFGSVDTHGVISYDSNVVRGVGGVVERKNVVVTNVTLSATSNKNYSLYNSEGTPVDKIELLSNPTSAYLNPYELIIDEDSISIAPITYDLAFDVNPSADNLIVRNYTISTGTLPNNEKVYIKVNNPRYLSLIAGSNIQCRFELAGVYDNASFSGAVNPNYTIRGNGVITVGATINKAVVQVSVEDIEATYGDMTHETPTLTYKINGDTLDATEIATLQSVMTAIISVTTSYTRTTPVGTIPITLNGGVAENYTFDITPGTLTIRKAPLTVTVEDVNVVKGSPIPTVFNIKVTGYRNSDVRPQTLPTATTDATYTSDYGEYTITLGGGYDPNYSFNYVNGSLNIVKGTVTGSSWRLPAVYSSVYGEHYKLATYNYGLAVSMEASASNIAYSVEYRFYHSAADRQNYIDNGTDGNFEARAINVGTYYVLAIVGNQDYAPEYLKGLLIVEPVTPTITLPQNTEVVYTGDTYSVRANANVGAGDGSLLITYNRSTTAPSAAGTYSVVASFTPTYHEDAYGNFVRSGGAYVTFDPNNSEHASLTRYSTNYNAATATATLNIAKAVITVRVMAEEFVSDGTGKQVSYAVNYAGGDSLPSGIVIIERYVKGGEEFVINPANAELNTGAPTAVGTYEYTFSLSDSTNYSLKLEGTASGYMQLGMASASYGGCTISSDGKAIIPEGDDVNAPTKPVVNDFGSEISTMNPDQQLLFSTASQVVGATNKVLDIFNIYLEVTEKGEALKSEGFGDATVTVTLDIPVGVDINNNVKLVRINDDGTYTDVKATYMNNTAVFTTDKLGNYAFVEFSADNTLFIYGAIGLVGFLVAAVFMALSIRKASIYRNMKAIVNTANEEE